MNIAIAVNGDVIGSQVSEQFECCKSLLIGSVAFELLAGAGVTRFLGTKHDGTMALVFMHANK